MSATDTLGRALLARARNAVAEDLGLPAVAAPDHQRLHQPGAVFVTLYTRGALRGCIGSLEPERALDADVATNARAAAFRDPRFAPLARDELAQTRFEVSVIGPSTPLPVLSEADAAAALIPHRDGVTLHFHGRRATLLPQVWTHLPDPKDFLRALKHKAGLPGDFWSPGIRLERYTVDHYDEAETAPA